MTINPAGFTGPIALAPAASEGSGEQVYLSIADRRAGRGPELVEKARRLGVPLVVEQHESAAGRAIRKYAEQNPPGPLIERLRAEARIK
jgi:hypothetical protein